MTFLRAGEFPDGLAAVRENGRYGYSNRSGEYVLALLYDYALPFERRVAKVYFDGVPALIDQQGKQVLPAGIEKLKVVYGHIAIITTRSQRMVLEDLNAFHFLADSVYGEIGDFAEELAVVKQYLKNEGKRHAKEAVIDTGGRMIVPFGK